MHNKYVYSNNMTGERKKALKNVPFGTLSNFADQGSYHPGSPFHLAVRRGRALILHLRLIYYNKY